MYLLAKKPLDRSTSPNIRAVSGDSIVLQLSARSDHRSARIAGSAAARHPAGGSTRRRSKVSSVTAVRFVLETT
jgi:hypothetical protein